MLLLGRQLLVLTIGRSPQSHVPLRPNVKYIGTIHGNEVCLLVSSFVE